MEVIDNIKTLCEKIAKDLNIQVFKVYFSDEEEGKTLHIELTKEGGIDLINITKFTKIINPLLDEMKELDFEYSLDCSSPGAERLVDIDELPDLLNQFLLVTSKTDIEVLGTLIDRTDDKIILKHFIKGKPKKTKILIADIKSIQLKIKF